MRNAKRVLTLIVICVIFLSLLIPFFFSKTLCLNLCWSYEGIIKRCKVINKKIFATKIKLANDSKSILLNLLELEKETGKVFLDEMIFTEEYGNEQDPNFSFKLFEHHFGNSDILINHNAIYASIEIGHDYDSKNFYKKFLWSVVDYDLKERQIKWRFNKEDSGTTPEASFGNLNFINDKGILFTALDETMTPPKRQLYLLDKINGNTIWQTEDPIGRIVGKPLVYQDKIYVTSQEIVEKLSFDQYKYASYMNCIDSRTGKPLWRVKIGDNQIAPRASPQVASGKVYVLTGHAADSAVLHCLSADNGKELWKRKIAGAERIFLYAEDRAIYATRGGYVEAYNMCNGRLKKRFIGLFSDKNQVHSTNNLIMVNCGSAIEVFDKRTARLLQIIGAPRKTIEYQLKFYKNQFYWHWLFRLRDVRVLLKKPNGILETSVGKNMLVADDMVYTYGDKGIFAYNIKQ
jgi:outer membrane protein assembly factor BamB